MKPPVLEYVISAPGSMGMFANSVFVDHHDVLKVQVLQCMDILNKTVRTNCKNTSPIISCLFNAYTEAPFKQKLAALDNLGSHSLYSDSGGLQIVTAGKSITPELKQKIYATQSSSDFAMCFDEIPLERTTEVRTINERSNIGNKIFNQDRHAESGALTGKNIKEQVQAFRKLNSDTKVIIIVQGNTAEDMVLYFQNIQDQLEDDDYKNIGGIAMADTCIGNGVLESVEMLKGAKAISKICHPSIKKHLHILGVGSIHRMRPILYLRKSGYLDTFERISYDSSSHTSTFRFGLLKVNGGCKALGMTRTARAEAHFRNVFDMFEEMLTPILTQDEFLDIILLDGQEEWSLSNVTKNAMKMEQDKKLVAFLSSTMHTYFQIANFVSCLDNVMQEDGENKKAIDALLGVTTDEDMQAWKAGHGRHVKTKRIMRKENYSTLEDLFQ